MAGRDPGTGCGRLSVHGPGGFSLTLRLAGEGLDPCRWFLASCAGMLACAALYTLHGLFLVHIHARMISEESALMKASGMTVLVEPGDAHLTAFAHLWGSALFFGLTLGLLCGLLCTVLTLPAWFSGRLCRRDLPLGVFAAAMCTGLGFSRECAWVACAAGALCPLAFTASWAGVLASGRNAAGPPRSWAFFIVVLMLPPAVLAAAGTSFTAVRDAMISTPVLSGISDFYYGHTLLAADVIKPVQARSQNVVAVHLDLGPVGPMPHGTLWVRTDDPCGVRGARVRLSPSPLECGPAVVETDGRPLNAGGRVFRDYASAFDPNRFMRRSVGIFLFSGPLIALGAFILSWAALGLSRSSRGRPAWALSLAALYLLLWAPAMRGACLRHELRMHPERLEEYSSSGSEQKRYAAITTLPSAIGAERLAALMRDRSPRVRLNALVEAGERGAPGLLREAAPLMRDPQVNVRTKACRAVGRMERGEALPLLRRVVREDLSWYVRDYAYAAIGVIEPEASEIVMTGGVPIPTGRAMDPSRKPRPSPAHGYARHAAGHATAGPRARDPGTLGPGTMKACALAAQGPVP